MLFSYSPRSPPDQLHDRPTPTKSSQLRRELRSVMSSFRMTRTTYRGPMQKQERGCWEILVEVIVEQACFSTVFCTLAHCSLGWLRNMYSEEGPISTIFGQKDVPIKMETILQKQQLRTMQLKRSNRILDLMLAQRWSVRKQLDTTKRKRVY